MSVATQRAARERLHDKLNGSIPGLTKPKVKRFITGANMDPFNNNAAHMAKMHGVFIESEKDLLMPLRMESNIGNSEEWRHATLDQRIQMAEQDWAGKVLDLPEYKPEDVECEHYGYMMIDIAAQMVGRRWDSITRAFLQAYRPSRIVLLDHETDPPFEAMWWRVTVKLTDMGRVQWVKQEVRVPLPRGVASGGDLRAKAENKL
jgi:hypothetical protein